MSFEGDVYQPKRPSFDSVLLTVASWSAQVLTAVILVISARLATFQEFSSLVSVLAITAVLVACVDFGSNSLWLVNLSSGKLGLQEWRKLISVKLTIGMIIFLLLSLSSFLFGRYFFEIGTLFIVQLLQHSLYVYHKVRNQNRFVAMTILLDRIIATALILLMVLADYEIGPYLFIPFLMGTLVASLVSINFMNREHRPMLVGVRQVSNYLSQTRDFGILSLIGAVRGLDVLVIGFWAGPTQTALYGSVAKWNMPLVVAAGSLSSVATPFLASKGLTRDVLKTLAGSIGFFVVTLMGGTFLAVNAELVVPLLLGDRYAFAAEVLRVSILGGALLAISTFLSSSLQALGQERFVGVSNLVCTVGQLATLSIIASTAGAVGAAWALCATQFLLIVLLVGNLLRRL